MVIKIEPFSCNTALIRDPIPDPQGKWTHMVFVQRDISTPTFKQHEYVSYVNGQKMKTETSGLINQAIATLFN